MKASRVCINGTDQYFSNHEQWRSNLAVRRTMSLFKSRTFWSTLCDDGEQFDCSSLKVSRLNSEQDYVLVGSHSGTLRVFQPSTAIEADGNVLSDYKPSDLYIEKNLNFSILQVEVGRLVSASPFVQIAVLHPRSFAVYSFTTKEGVTEQGNQNMVNLLYEHKLRRSAASFCVGPFGGTQNRDFIAVQSLDGMLSFFEQETFVFCCFLPNFLLPGPFVYSKRTDSFIVTGSSLNIDSYSYKILSSIGQNTDETDVTGLKFEPDWSFNLSEGVVDTQYLYDGFSKESFLVILGERNLYCLTDSGKLKFMKRLDYSPCCFTSYMLGENKLMTLVVSETNTLLVYQNTSLRWSSNLPNLPVAISRAHFKNLRGVLVSLDETGSLQCSYFGTQPSLFSAPPLVNQELDFEQAETELLTLNKMIRSSYSNDIKLSNKNAERELTVNIDIDKNLLNCTHPHKLQEVNDLKMCLLSVQIVPHAVFEEVNIVVHVQKPLVVFPQSELYNNLTEKTDFHCHVYMSEEAEVVSLTVDVVVSCVSNIGLPRVMQKTATLPFNLIAKITNPMKESTHKITLNINKNSVPLSILFPEFVGENTLTSNSNAVCFTNVSSVGVPVTILLAKSSQRYRLQSDSIASLSVCVAEMVRRLKHHYDSDKSFKVFYNSALPIAQLLQLVNEHFEYRRKVIFLQEELIQLGAQFRMIQKRLISKFKDKNPTPLTNLDMLLSDTYKQTLDVTTKLENANADLSGSQVSLSCALQLVLELIKIMEDVKNPEIFENAFSPYIYDIDGQNWEDTLDISLSYLIRTVLAKSEKDKLRAPHTCYEEVKDVSKLEKHINLVLERVTKRGSIVEAQKSQEEEVEKIPEEENKELLPAGSRLGESSTRILSARHSLLRKRQKVRED